MATTYGAPTGLDLSACTLSADGGKTNQTLAALGATVAGNATAVAAAQADATAAKTEAAQASADAADAKTAVGNLGASYVKTSTVGQNNGVAALDAGGNLTVAAGGIGNPTTGATSFLMAGNSGGNQYGALQLGNGGNVGGPATLNTWNDGTGRQLAVDANAFHPGLDNTTSLGLADHAWSNVYSKTAVQVTSDAAQKTVIGSLGDTTYSDGQKLAQALFGIDTELFKLNASISAKGADKARLHAGFIAQKVEAAISAVGLDPSDFALWTNSPVYDVEQKPTGATGPDGKPVTVATAVARVDASGKQVYTQMLRYDQILCVLFDAAKQKIAQQGAAYTALEARVAALEAKAGA